MTTAAALLCDDCGQAIDGRTFGRRVTENVCFTCWMVRQDAQAAECAERERQRQAEELATARRELKWLKRDRRELKRDIKRARKRLSKLEKAEVPR